jgi:hypothetical protein
VLADFQVAVTLEGERHIVICRDVPTAVFFYGFPNVPPATKCSQKQTDAERHAEWLQTQTWAFEMLSRATVTPHLPVDMLYRLDDGAFDGIVAYWYAVGWFTDDDLDRQAELEGPIGEATKRFRQSLGALADELLPVPEPASKEYRMAHLPFVGDIAPNVRAKIRLLALKTHTRPSILWQSPISETMLDYRLMVDDAVQEAKTADRPGRPAELYEMGGIEEYPDDE